MGYTGWKTLTHKVIRLPKSYPVFRPGFEQPLADVLARVDAIGNLRTVGRQGSFNYVGTLDSKDTRRLFDADSRAEFVPPGLGPWAEPP